MAANRIVVGEFGTAGFPDPCKNIFQRFLTVFEKRELSDNTLVNIFPLQDELYAATETCFMNRVDPQTLDRIEKVNLEEKMGVNLATAHPHYDGAGNMYNVGHSFKRGLETVFVAAPPKKDDETSFPTGHIISRLKSPWKVHINYFHSFSMTENYFVFVQQPLLSNIPKIVFGTKVGYAFDSSLTFYPDIKTRFRIIDRKTGEEINKDCVYETDSFVFFHQINAYEEHGHIILDLVCHKDKSIIDMIYLKKLTSSEVEKQFRAIGDPQARRYVLPLAVGKKSNQAEMVTLAHTTARCKRLADGSLRCEPEVIADVGIEFPQISYEKVNGKKYRYFYGVGFHVKEKNFQSLVKVDTNTKTYKRWVEDGCYPSEPVFVPKPGALPEDEGVLLAAINKLVSKDSSTCFLLVLDARTFSEMARIEFDGIDRFPRDFHGVFTATK